VEVEISELNLEGLLWVKDNLETNIAGFYSGCVFLQLSGSICGGYYAGQNAARAAKEVAAAGRIDEALAAREKERIFAPLKREEGLSFREIEGRSLVMDYYWGWYATAGHGDRVKSLRLIGTYRPVPGPRTDELLRSHESLFLHKTCELTVVTV
jgi:succinate dehydrogenase/fumarate reductase flavoprotein subunit